MEENPFQSPESLTPSGEPPAQNVPSGGALKYVVATVGAVLVFVGAVLCVFVLAGFVLPELYQGRNGLLLLWPVALLLAALAAIHSFRATLRAYSGKTEKTDRR